MWSFPPQLSHSRSLLGSYRKWSMTGWCWWVINFLHAAFETISAVMLLIMLLTYSKTLEHQLLCPPVITCSSDAFVAHINLRGATRKLFVVIVPSTNFRWRSPLQVQNASDLLIKPLEKFRKEQIGVTKVSVVGFCWFLPVVQNLDQTPKHLELLTQAKSSAASLDIFIHSALSLLWHDNNNQVRLKSYRNSCGFTSNILGINKYITAAQIKNIY